MRAGVHENLATIRQCFREGFDCNQGFLQLDVNPAEIDDYCLRDWIAEHLPDEYTFDPLWSEFGPDGNYHGKPWDLKHLDEWWGICPPNLEGFLTTAQYYLDEENKEAAKRNAEWEARQKKALPASESTPALAVAVES